MPYIKKGDGRREALRKGEPAKTAGELNYQIFYYAKHNDLDYSWNYDDITTFVNNFLGDKPNYQRFNDMTGCLIRCKKEIERRLKTNANILISVMETYDGIIADYEDEKIEENGDVE